MEQTITSLTSLLGVAGDLITWSLSTYPINLYVVGSVAGVAVGLICLCKRAF